MKKKNNQVPFHHSLLSSPLVPAFCSALFPTASHPIRLLHSASSWSLLCCVLYAFVHAAAPIQSAQVIYLLENLLELFQAISTTPSA